MRIRNVRLLALLSTLAECNSGDLTPCLFESDVIVAGTHRPRGALLRP